MVNTINEFNCCKSRRVCVTPSLLVACSLVAQDSDATTERRSSIVDSTLASHDVDLGSRYQGTTCTTWLNLYTPCKSQWSVSPTAMYSMIDALCHYHQSEYTPADHGVHPVIGVRANIHLGGQTEFCPDGFSGGGGG